MDAEKAILTRRSTRRFLNRPIEKQIIEKMLKRAVTPQAAATIRLIIFS